MRRRVDLNRLVAATADTLARASGKCVLIQLRLAGEPLPVLADRLKLERILLNLVINARDAMAGGGVITIKSGIIDIQSQRCAQLTVTDTGCGIAPEVRRRIFEPYFTTKDAGTGLGLSSVQFMVRQLNGDITIESEPGHGTSVTIVLPLAADHISHRCTHR